MIFALILILFLNNVDIVMKLLLYYLEYRFQRERVMKKSRYKLTMIVKPVFVCVYDICFLHLISLNKILTQRVMINMIMKSESHEMRILIQQKKSYRTIESFHWPDNIKKPVIIKRIIEINIDKHQWHMLDDQNYDFNVTVYVIAILFNEKWLRPINRTTNAVLIKHSHLKIPHIHIADRWYI